MNEITVFTNGDSEKISTWSNVPYFFTETLIARGIKVNRVNIKPLKIIKALHVNFIHKILKKFNKDSRYTYLRSYLHSVNARYLIKNAINRYPNSDAFVFLTFSFSSAGLTNKPTILFSDWTFGYYFDYFRNREPDILEQKCIKRENWHVENANIVVSLFPSVTDYMQKVYKNKNIIYLGNVINSLYKASEKEIIDLKTGSNNIIFVGSKKYIEGARALIEAFVILKEKIQNLKLQIIGMETRDFSSLPKDITCYGYLDKGKNEDRELYYKILKEAKVFVNTTPKWGAFSASIEAMYFYTPVIVFPYTDFLETFGKNLDFGYYCQDNSPELITDNILKLFSNKNYHSLCRQAHKSVEQFTWDSYIEKMLKAIEIIKKTT